MKKILCDICGKEIKSDNPVVDIWNKNVFMDMFGDPIEDVCDECYKMIYCCINMMKEVGWKPDFHEKLKSESVFDSDKAGFILEELEDITKLKLM